MPAWPHCEPRSPGELSVATGPNRSSLLPDDLPLSPAARLRRGTVHDVLARPGQGTEPGPGEIEQLLSGEEVNAEPFLRSFLVPDCAPTESVLLHHGVTEVDLGRRRVDSQKEQAAGSQRRRRLGEVRGRVGRDAVLKDLNGDEVVERPIDLEVEKVPAREAWLQLGSASGQLLDRFPEDVQPLKVQPGVDEGQIVAAVAAADIET